ncbi:MAG TPA: hypothetical protein VLI04_12850 [Nocardioidaceae bacterium]|nr:hypothetical protein [Nocardioidaceae bacterium]
MLQSTDEQTLHPISARDAASLIGVLSVLEATSRGGHLDNDLAHSLKLRLHRDGLIAKTDLGQEGLRAALNELNLRLRHALGEDD